jgi:hypothetical protein
MGNENAVIPAPITGRNVRIREHTAFDRSALSLAGTFRRCTSLVLADGSKHGPGEPLSGCPFRDLADIESQHTAACSLDTLDNLALDAQAAHEPVEVGSHDHVRVTGLDRLYGAVQARPAFKWSPAADIHLILDSQQGQTIAVAGSFYALALLHGRREAIAIPALDLAHADDAYRSALGGDAGSLRLAGHYYL